MIRKIFAVFILCFIPFYGTAQSLSVSVTDHSQGSNSFQLKEGAVAINSSGIRFLATGNRVSGFAAYGISPDLSTLGVLNTGYDGSQVVILNSRGDTLVSNTVSEVSAGDPSLGVYPSNTGEVLVRDNINRFSFYDTFGNLVAGVSSGSQSEEGEVISEVEMDPFGKTTVIYNPKIKRSGGLGSRAQILEPSGSLEEIYFSNTRILKQVKVSRNGQFIALVTAREGSRDEIIFTDRYGNELSRMESEDNVFGVRISNDARHLTVYSTRRALVYEALSGERIGSTSFSSTLFMAEYFPEDEMIIGLTGDFFESSGILNNVQFHAIHLGQRKLARDEAGTGLIFNSSIPPRLVRSGPFRYRLLGSNKSVEIRAAF